MAKKAQPKRSAPKARGKQPVAKKAAKPRATSKYDQPGAPWWKKFRPTEAGPAESKR